MMSTRSSLSEPRSPEWAHGGRFSPRRDGRALVAGRVIREVLALMGVALAVLALLALVIDARTDLEPGELLGVIPEFVFSFTGFALASWGLLVALAATLLRRRGPWWRIGAHALSALVAGVVNVVAVVAIGEAQNAQGGFVGALGLLGTVVFVPVALLITPIVVLLLERGRPAAGAGSPGPAETVPTGSVPTEPMPTEPSTSDPAGER